MTCPATTPGGSMTRMAGHKISDDGTRADGEPRFVKEGEK